MPLLLEACPSFREAWEREVQEENLDEDSPAGRLFYLDAGAVIRHLVQLRLDGVVDEFPAVFEVLERLVLEGDDYVQNLAIIGYLEGMQMMTVTGAALDPETDFRPFCTATLDTWWDRINRFWAGDATALND